ncbi:GNAT family N-acetyltransferase [Virgibacillus sp. 7505]|uniref:GNAT family N-acetyltransferase n=1 Tax=Virgibacillus sp. 7505 TaxID=2022548 RepID=UPI000BA50EEB|nr:GNAT family N-acetyltransferase [Virgibacillus sp. 7505]PAE17403.1 GNAT family N-acetyltransferase [Virgibacillus sp. 7505]
MEIRKAEPAHAEAIAYICAKGWRQTVEGKLSKEAQKLTVEHWYNLDRVKVDINAGGYNYVAIAEEEVVGVIGGKVTAPEMGEVFVLYVDEKLRYQGTGTLLLDALTQDQKKQGARKQWVSVQEGNQLGIPFYEARGFCFQEKKTTLMDTGETQVSLRYYREL